METADKRLSGYRTYDTCLLWELPMEAIDAMQCTWPSIHDKLSLGLKKTVRLCGLDSSLLDLSLQA